MADPCLWDPERRPVVDPADALAIAHAFAVRCRAWAVEREIPRRVQDLASDPRQESAAKLHAWVAWRDFLDHALGELENGTLDHWFEAPDKS